MVTECNGHMYPTKRFDQEERLFEHALRHARVHSRAGTDPHIAGLISWCAFDYNTHHNFGSGDHICYHGVMDMFRIPKMAAHFYRSQVAPQTEVVLEPATLWTRGERSIGGVSPLVIFTNCEYVECYYGDELVGTYRPSAAMFPGLEYPPIVEHIDMEPWVGTWGLSWRDGRFVGYVNGAPALERRFTNNPVPTALDAAADDTTLRADGVDVTRVVYRALDQAGNLLPYLPDFLKLSLHGPGAIIGPSEVALIGGCTGVWVKAGTTPGTLTLSAVSTRLRANDVTIAVAGV
jgi:beta-galactosidase